MKKIGLAGRIFDGVLVFLFVFVPVFNFIPLPFSKVVILYLFLHVFLKNETLALLADFRSKNFFKYTFFVCLISGIYFFNVTTLRGQYNFAFVQAMFWFFVEGVMGSFLLFQYLAKRYELITILNIVLNVIFFQSITVLLAFASADIRNLFDSLLVLTDERYISSYRIRGFANNGGAGLSYLQCIGVFSGSLSLILDGRKQVYKLVKLLVITISMFFVARTGLMFSILIIGFTLLQNSYNNGSIFTLLRYLLFSLLGIFLVYTVVIPLLPAQSQTVLQERVFERVFEFYYSYEETGELETKSTDALANMYFLPNSTSGVFFGEGIWDSSGNRIEEGATRRQVDSDVGFIRLIFAIGIPLAILFYSIYVVYLYELKRVYFIRRFSFLLVSLFLIFLVGETKEPFLVRMSGIIKLLVIIYCVILSMNKERLLNEER